MNVSLETQSIIVTGAASGIGRAVAEHAAAAGADGLLLTDVDEAGLQNVAEALGNGTPIQIFAADLAEPEAASRICDQAKAAFGRIDGLVNAAGLTTRAGFLDGSAEVWDRLFAVNARAPFLLMQTVIAEMLRHGRGGTIVNIQSINAHCGAPDLAIYSATKGALQTLTKNAANAHLKDGVRVNGVNLGWTLTEAEDRLQSDVLGGGKDWAERAGRDLPLGRLLRPDEAARMVVYLLSAASAPLTGVSLDLDQSVAGAPR
ncbi:MAG: SDR family oxidoreductase [Silicimonas sp.]|nr:SDR family oxidoreductase [Silicimonas sp.]